MIKFASRRVGIVLAGSALALAGGLVPALAATSGWRTTATVAVRGSATLFTGVAASSSSDAWAAGSSWNPRTLLTRPIIKRWTGKTWRQVTLPAKLAKTWASQDPTTSAIAVSSARSVWIFNTYGGSYLRLNGTRWSLGQLPGVNAKTRTIVLVDAVKVFSGTNVWAFGEQETVTGNQPAFVPYSAHYNGRTWSEVTVPGLQSGLGLITAVAAVSANDILAVESSVDTFTLPVILHLTNPRAGWRHAARQPTLQSGDQLTSGVAEPGGHVWFGGSAANSANGTTPLTAEWNGTSWSVKDLPMRASSAYWQLTAMTPDGTGGIWALAANNTSESERIWHRHGTTWSQVKPAFGKQWQLEAMTLVPRTHSVWGVGTVQGSSKRSANGLIAVEGSLPR